jgi:hypothetical protein
MTIGTVPGWSAAHYKGMKMAATKAEQALVSGYFRREILGFKFGGWIAKIAV